MIFISTESSAKLFNIFWEKNSGTRDIKILPFIRLSRMRRLNFAQNLKQKRFCWGSANFWKWHKTYNWKNEGFKFVKLQWKHVMTFPFAAKSYTKSQFNEVKRTFNCHFFTFKVKVRLSLFKWSFLKVAIQWKWKELSTVILALLSHFFLKVAIQWKWKGLSTVILTLFSQSKPV